MSGANLDKKTVIIIVLVLLLLSGGAGAAKNSCRNLAGEDTILGNICLKFTSEAVGIVEETGLLNGSE